MKLLPSKIYETLSTHCQALPGHKENGFANTTVNNVPPECRLTALQAIKECIFIYFLALFSIRQITIISTCLQTCESIVRVEI